MYQPSGVEALGTRSVPSGAAVQNPSTRAAQFRLCGAGFLLGNVGENPENGSVALKTYAKRDKSKSFSTRTSGFQGLGLSFREWSRKRFLNPLQVNRWLPVQDQTPDDGTKATNTRPSFPYRTGRKTAATRPAKSSAVTDTAPTRISRAQQSSPATNFSVRTAPPVLTWCGVGTCRCGIATGHFDTC